MLKINRLLAIVVLSLFLVSCGGGEGGDGSSSGGETGGGSTPTSSTSSPSAQKSTTDASGQVSFQTSDGQLVSFTVRDNDTQQSLSNVTVSFQEAQNNEILVHAEDTNGTYLATIYQDSLSNLSASKTDKATLSLNLLESFGFETVIDMVNTAAAVGEGFVELVEGIAYKRQISKDMDRVGASGNIRCITVQEAANLFYYEQDKELKDAIFTLGEALVGTVSDMILPGPGTVIGYGIETMGKKIQSGLLTKEVYAETMMRWLKNQNYIPTASLREVIAVDLSEKATLRRTDGEILWVYMFYPATSKYCGNNSSAVPPSNVKATPVSSNQIDLSWDDTSNESAYIIKFTTDGSNFQRAGSVNQNVTKFSHKFLSPNTTYYYRIYSWNSKGISTTYSEARATTSGQQNQTLIISSVTANPSSVNPNGTSTVTCNAYDPNNDPLTYSWTASGGSISGSGSTVTWTAPSAAGTYTVTCRVSNGKGGTASKDVNITVTESTTPFSITTTSLSSGTVGVSYPATNLSATGGKTPYSWSVISGSLPAGLSLSAGGIISGTPTTAGTFNFTVQVTDSSSPQQTATKALSITITSTQTFTLTVNKTGTGSGTVTSSPAGINCGGTCSASFNQGAFVTLTPTPTSGSTFAGWSGVCTGTGTCTVTMDANKSVTATFKATTAGVLQVTPSDGLASSGPLGGPFSPSSKTFTLSNTGSASINWTASKGQSWVNLSSTSGTLSPGANTTVTVSINSNASTLSVGNYSDTVNFTNTTNGNGNQNRSVNLTVASTPVTPPAAPSNLSATALSQNKIALTWRDNSNNETGFKIERKTGTSGTFSQIATASAISGTGSGGYYESTGLSAGTTYCYRVRAYNSAGDSSYSSESCATTNSSTTQPTATTGSATNITSSSATLNGTVNPNGVSTGAFFQYGTSTSYGYTTSSQVIGSGTSNVSVTANLTGLSPNTTYHFRIVATNSSGGTTFGANKTFTTTSGSTGSAPTATTGSATSVTSNSATLNGTVNPNGLSTDVWFRYGTTTSFGSATSIQSIGGGTSSVSVSKSLTGLSPSTTYYYQVVAYNSAGTTYGATQTFTTSSSSTSLSFTSLTPSTISTSTAGYQATLSATGRNFNNVKQVTFTWVGATSGTVAWFRGDANWNAKVTVNSDSSMTLRPVVTASGDPAGTTTWYVTLTDTTGVTASRSFTVTYTR